MTTSKNVAGDPLDEALVAALALAHAPRELGAGQRERMRERMCALAREATPPGTSILRAAADRWQRVAPLIEVRVLSRDREGGSQTILLKVAPGGVLPGHVHAEREELYVLEGECHVGTHRLVAGDLHVAECGAWHDDISTDTGVVVLLHGEYPDPYARAARATPA